MVIFYLSSVPVKNWSFNFTFLPMRRPNRTAIVQMIVASCSWLHRCGKSLYAGYSIFNRYISNSSLAFALYIDG